MWAVGVGVVALCVCAVCVRVRARGAGSVRGAVCVRGSAGACVWRVVCVQRCDSTVQRQEKVPQGSLSCRTRSAAISPHSDWRRDGGCSRPANTNSMNEMISSRPPLAVQPIEEQLIHHDRSSAVDHPMAGSRLHWRWSGPAQSVQTSDLNHQLDDAHSPSA